MDALQRRLGRMEIEFPSPSWNSVPRISDICYFLKRWLTCSVSKVPQNPTRYVEETREEKLFDIGEYAEITPSDSLSKLKSRWNRLQDSLNLSHYSDFRGLYLRTEQYDLSESLNPFDPDYIYRIMINGYLGKDENKWYFICLDINKRKSALWPELSSTAAVKTVTEASYPISFEIVDNLSSITKAEIEHHRCDKGSKSDTMITRKAREYWVHICKDIECKIPGFLEYFQYAPLGIRSITRTKLKERNNCCLDKYFNLKEAIGGRI